MVYPNLFTSAKVYFFSAFSFVGFRNPMCIESISHSALSDECRFVDLYFCILMHTIRLAPFSLSPKSFVFTQTISRDLFTLFGVFELQSAAHWALVHFSVVNSNEQAKEKQKERKKNILRKSVRTQWTCNDGKLASLTKWDFFRYSIEWNTFVHLRAVV